jgi:GNAT superfamily N-acetyltransferase
VDVEVTVAGADSSEIALGFFRQHLTHVFAQVKEEYGIVYDVESALQHDREELPKFLPPAGRMLIARAEGRALGIGCLKLIGPRMGEVKHLFVDPGLRGRGVGRKLTEAIISEARGMGMEILRLDSGRLQTPAHALYRSLGFVEIPRYPESPIPESNAHAMLFMELKLS